MIPKQDEIVKSNIYGSFTNADEIRKAKRRTYRVGEISPNTGLQKQPDGSWAPPKKGSKKKKDGKNDEKKGPQIYGRGERSVFTKMFFYNDHRARRKYKEKHGEEKYNEMKELYEEQRAEVKRKKKELAEKITESEKSVEKELSGLDNAKEILDVSYNKRADLFDVTVQVKGIDDKVMLSPQLQHLGVEDNKEYKPLIEEIENETSFKVTGASNKKKGIDRYHSGKLIISLTKTNDSD